MADSSAPKPPQRGLFGLRSIKDPKFTELPIGLLLLAAVALVGAMLAGTILLSKPSGASTPTAVKTVTKTPTSIASSAKPIPSWSPTGSRYTPSPIIVPTAPPTLLNVPEQPPPPPPPPVTVRPPQVQTLPQQTQQQTQQQQRQAPATTRQVIVQTTRR